MLGHIAQLNTTMKGLAVIAENQNVVIRMLAKNWPITLLAVGALGTQLMRRYKAKTLTLHQAFGDAGMVLVPLTAIMTLKKIAADSANTQQPVATAAPAPGPAAPSILGRIA